MDVEEEPPGLAQAAAVRNHAVGAHDKEVVGGMEFLLP
jgi:hypothetical protein